MGHTDQHIGLAEHTGQIAAAAPGQHDGRHITLMRRLYRRQQGAVVAVDADHQEQIPTLAQSSHLARSHLAELVASQVAAQLRLRQRTAVHHQGCQLGTFAVQARHAHRGKLRRLRP
ncbi:hypothetical protein D3C72_1575600 [compost metagenome]